MPDLRVGLLEEVPQWPQTPGAPWASIPSDGLGVVHWWSRLSTAHPLTWTRRSLPGGVGHSQ